MIRKISAIILVGVIFLVGCGGNDSTQSKPVANGEVKTESGTNDEIKTDLGLLWEDESRVDLSYSPDEDSDYDGLNDLEEVEDYKTDPLKEDTDGDGADDLWEVNNASDPCAYDEKFLTILKSEEVTEYNMVSMEVEVLLDKEQIYDVDLQPVTYSDNPFLGPTTAGYLGCAYSFEADGKVDAVLTFRYNTDEYGIASEEFVPCIYYFDEEAQLFEEISYESGGDGCVVGKVNKAGTYMLLDKIQHDKIWSLNLGI